MARSVRSGRRISAHSSSAELDEIEQLDELGAAHTAESISSTPRTSAARARARPSISGAKRSTMSSAGPSRSASGSVPPASPIVISSRSPSARPTCARTPSASLPLIVRGRKRKAGPGYVNKAYSSEDEDGRPSRNSRARLVPISDGGSQDEDDDSPHIDRASDKAGPSRPFMSSARNRRPRPRLVIEVPLMPLSNLRHYSLPPDTTGPSTYSRRRLGKVDSDLDSSFESDSIIRLGSEDSDDYARNQGRGLARQSARRKEKLAALVAQRRPRWTIRSSPEKSRGTRSSAARSEGESELYTDVENEAASSSELDGSEDEEDEDDFFVRRSKRARGARNGRGPRRSDVSLSLASPSSVFISTTTTTSKLPAWCLSSTVHDGYIIPFTGSLRHRARP